MNQTLERMFGNDEKDIEYRTQYERIYVKWLRPVSGTYVLNCEGSYLEYRKEYRCGFLVRNHWGRLLGAGSLHTAGEGDPLFYELQAIRKGMEMVKCMGLVWFR